MPVQYVTSPQACLPPAADAVAVTPSGSAWVSSAYVELTPSMPCDGALTGVTLQTSYGGDFQMEVEVDIAQGAVGAEVVVATFRGHSYNLSGMEEMPYLTIHLPLDVLTIGSRVATRVRTNHTSVLPWYIACTYLVKPIVGRVLTTTRTLKCCPSAANGTVCSITNTSWANNAWAQIIASTPAAWVLVAANIYEYNNNGLDTEVDLAIGAPGSEVIITTLRQSHGSIGGVCDSGMQAFPNPLDAIPAGARISARARGSDTFTASVSVCLMYVEKPL